MNVTYDVQTGRFTQPHAGQGADSRAHRSQRAWWTVSVFRCVGPAEDGHTYEVYLANVGRHHRSPTWPVLALFSGEDAQVWAKKLLAFAKTISAEEDGHYDKEVGGDGRLAAWLTGHGFKRYNHIWWSLHGP